MVRSHRSPKGGKITADLFIVPQSKVKETQKQATQSSTRKGCVISWEDAFDLVEAGARSNELDWLASFADGILYGYTSMTKPFEVPIDQLSDLWAYVDKACAWVDKGKSQSRVGSFSLIDGELGYTRGERSFWLDPSPDDGSGLWRSNRTRGARLMT